MINSIGYMSLEILKPPETSSVPPPLEVEPEMKSMVDLANEKQEEKFEDMGGDLFRNKESGIYYEAMDLEDPESPIPVKDVHIFMKSVGTDFDRAETGTK